MAVVEAEHDGVSRSFLPGVLALNPRGADHARTVPPRVTIIARRPFPA
jgi:hypothetical protein